MYQPAYHCTAHVARTSELPRMAKRLGLAAICAAAAVFSSIADVAAKDHAYTILYSFNALPDAQVPDVRLIQDSLGNFYGATLFGGSGSCGGGCGAVFKLAPDGTESVLHSFQAGSDGWSSYGSLIQDSQGNLYGVTLNGGGKSKDCGGRGCGIVFKIAPNGDETILHTFTGGSTDGALPSGGLTFGKNGVLVGTTTEGGGTGCHGVGCGTIFTIAPDGTETILYSFSGTDGANPYSQLVKFHGNFYGTTGLGGANDEGAVFEVTPEGSETTLYSFKGGSDGAQPYGDLLSDGQGNLVGTTFFGGSTGNGTVFKLASDGTETLLYSFQGGSDGESPHAGLIKDRRGNFYGTTSGGGVNGLGTVFKLAPDGTESVLHSFSSTNGDGYVPQAALTKGMDGHLYGVTNFGGTADHGTVFTIAK
jgi:uncharacterized repeat protein (TIGR03803 family)